MTEKHILVVDDDARLRKLLRDYLSSQGFFVVTAEDAAEARRKLEILRFDALVVDRMMPGEDGLSFTRAVQAQQAPILMLTAMGEAQDRIDGLEAGARDYLSKPFEPKELVLRLQNLLRQAPPRQRILSFGDYRLNLTSGELRCGDEPVYLTDSERTHLLLLGRNVGVPVSRQELSGSEAGERSIDVQINRLRKKLEPHSPRPRYIQTVRGAGYVLRADGC
jgi:two-component system phosphate regulon response regulator OmpR